MTRRHVSLVSVVALVSTFLVLGDLGLAGSAQAQQPTQSGVKAKGKAAAGAAVIKWDSLSTDQKDQVKTSWKTDAEKAKVKWDGMTVDQQQKYIAEAKAGGQQAAAVWQTLPK